jgi:hypothetical protein
MTSNGSAVASAELYNPATGKWAPTGSMSSAREGQVASSLSDGNVLVTAGVEGNGPFAEFYNPVTGRWSAASGGLSACTLASDCRVDSSATLLGDGDVLVAGGLTGTAANPGSTVSAILYHPATNSWTTTGSLTTAHYDQTASLLKSGQVLIRRRGRIRQARAHSARERRPLHPLAAPVCRLRAAPLASPPPVAGRPEQGLREAADLLGGAPEPGRFIQ